MTFGMTCRGHVIPNINCVSFSCYSLVSIGKYARGTNTIADCTVNERVMGSAALQVALPDWLAVIVQVPAAASVTVLPVMVQTAGVVLLNVTARSDVAVALKPNAGSPTVLLASAANVMVWLALFTSNDCVSCGAALYALLPAWLAAIVQVPAATSVTVGPEGPPSGPAACVLNALVGIKPPLTVHTTSAVQREAARFGISDTEFIRWPWWGRKTISRTSLASCAQAPHVVKYSVITFY